MFWDRVAGVYDLFADVYNRKVNTELCEQVASLMGTADEVLECGCGTGMLSAAIAPRCASLIATDFSERMLVRARRKCAGARNARFEKADITDLSYADGSFDKVVAANVIHLLDDPASAVRELARVCRPGGMLVVPTYVNRERTGAVSGFSRAVGKAGADFKEEFTFGTYGAFFKRLGCEHVDCTLICGRVPCAVAVISLPDPRTSRGSGPCGQGGAARSEGVAK